MTRGQTRIAQAASVRLGVYGLDHVGMEMSACGTKLPIEDVRPSVAIGGKPGNMCSV